MKSMFKKIGFGLLTFLLIVGCAACAWLWFSWNGGDIRDGGDTTKYDAAVSAFNRQLAVERQRADSFADLAASMEIDISNLKDSKDRAAASYWANLAKYEAALSAGMPDTAGMLADCDSALRDCDLYAQWADSVIITQDTLLSMKNNIIQGHLGTIGTLEDKSLFLSHEVDALRGKVRKPRIAVTVGLGAGIGYGVRGFDAGVGVGVGIGWIVWSK